MSKINYQELREAAERAIPEMELLTLPFDAWLSKQELKDYGVDIDVINTFRLLAGPETMLELLDEIKRQEDTNIDATCRISELETILATLVAENAGLRHVMTTSIEHENVEIEQTAGCPRFKLKGKDRLIADLRKQRAEWIRKALRYSEERAALAKRIEEMEQANTRQDANINHQQEGVTQSVTRYIYHYNAVNGSDSMSGIARLVS